MYTVKVGDTEYQIAPNSKNNLDGEINGQPYHLDLTGSEGSFSLIFENKSYNVQVVSADFDTKSFVVRVNGNDYELSAMDRFDQLLKELGMDKLQAAGAKDLKAPMPGLVLNVNVNAGDTVQKGDALLVLEAMKMENILKAADGGTVSKVVAETGMAVEKNQVLIEFE